jgi:hypothetical protein
MENLFIRNDHKGLKAAVVAGTLAVAVLVYLLLTDSGKDVRSNLKKKATKKAKDVASGALSKKTGLPKKAIKKVVDHIVK